MNASSVDAALQKLAAALARIEDAVDSRVEGARANAGRDVEVQALSDDRARLAAELDQSFARTARLESANREVSARLDQAIESIQDILAPQVQLS